MAKKEKKDEQAKKSGKRWALLPRGANRRLIPPFIMLTAGAISSILMARGGYELHDLLLILLLVLLLFYILGCILKSALDRIEKQNAPVETEEGEVIEKEPEEKESDTENTETEE